MVKVQLFSHDATTNPTSDSSPLASLVVTRKQAAGLTTLSLRSIDSRIANGEIKASRIGTRILIEVDSLKAMLRRNVIKPTAEVQHGL